MVKIIDKIFKQRENTQFVQECYLASKQIEGLLGFRFVRSETDLGLNWEIEGVAFDDPQNGKVVSNHEEIDVGNELALKMKYIFENAYGFIFEDKIPNWHHGVETKTVGSFKLNTENNLDRTALSLLEQAFLDNHNDYNRIVSTHNLPNEVEVRNLKRSLNLDGRIFYVDNDKVTSKVNYVP